MKPNWIFHFCFILTISPEECQMKSFGKKNLLLHAIFKFCTTKRLFKYIILSLSKKCNFLMRIIIDVSCSPAFIIIEIYYKRIFYIFFEKLMGARASEFFLAEKSDSKFLIRLPDFFQ